MVDGLISGKPRLRGVSHEWAFFISLPLGLGLVISAPSGRAAVAAGIYALSVALLFGASALYHRITWASEAARRWMRRVDHSMIFVLIAGTYTPFALLALDGTLATAILIAVWVGAGAGVVMSLVWPDAPKWLLAVVYVALGWVAIAAFPAMLDRLGITAMVMVGAGGALYTAGAVIYATRRPNPSPTVFGYHEIFHALVIGAAALQYAVVAFYVVPNA
jgi:hemolysin III